MTHQTPDGSIGNGANWLKDVRRARDNYRDNLLMMATGSYLRDTEWTNWDPPYPESAVSDAIAVVDQMINECVAFNSLAPEADEVSSSAFMTAIESGIQSLIRVSDNNGGLLVDTEEIEDLLSILDALCTSRMTMDTHQTSQDQLVSESAIDHGDIRQLVIELIEE